MDAARCAGSDGSFWSKGGCSGLLVGTAPVFRTSPVVTSHPAMAGPVAQVAAASAGVQSGS